MRSIAQFSFIEWLTFKPVSFLWKELRNDFILFFYKLLEAKNEANFLAKNISSNNKNIIVIIAFEQPQVLEWLFLLAQKNLTGAQLMVFDNSKRVSLRTEIESVCQRYEIPYLALPKNPTRHVNRSHGMAMTWVYYRIIKKLRPQWFAYIDHDLLPVKAIDIEDLLKNKNRIYGLLRKKAGYWNLWAGYAFYSYSAVKDLPLNWLYDFSRLLDTGGRNWDCLYSQINIDQLESNLAKENFSQANIQDHQVKLQVVDQGWLHVGGVSYNNNFSNKGDTFMHIVDKLLNGSVIEDILCLRGYGE